MSAIPIRGRLLPPGRAEELRAVLPRPEQRAVMRDWIARATRVLTRPPDRERSA